MSLSIPLRQPLHDVLLPTYLDDVYVQDPATAVEAAFHEFSQLCKNIGLDMATEKCEAWSSRNPASTRGLSERLGMKCAEEGIVAAGCPLGSPDLVQFEANTTADKVVQVVKRVLALPFSTQDTLL